jgi:uncharacterized protein (DUF169 family)
MDKIGIGFTRKRPNGINRLEEKLTHCAMVAMARDGEVFYAEPENFKCALSRFNLGLQKRVDAFKNSVVKYLISHGHAKDEETALRCLESKRPLGVGRKYLIYSSLDKSPIEPDLAILIGSPKEIMEVVHKISKNIGKTITACISGTSAICGEVTALPLLTDEPNISLGCCGSRNFGKLKESELVMGIPMNERYKEYALKVEG